MSRQNRTHVQMMIMKEVAALCLLVATLLLVARHAEALDTIDIGHYDLSACREANATLEWTLPPNVKHDFVYLYITAKPTPDYPIPREQLVVSKYRTDDWKWDEKSTRYRGRIFNRSLTSFWMENSLVHDRGMYRIEVRSPQAYYNGTTDFMVFAEDNLYPRSMTENVTDVAELDEDGNTQYRYRFVQPDDSPSNGVHMSASTESRTSEIKSCYFEESTLCDIVFTAHDLKGMSGTVVFDIEPQFVVGTPVCRAVTNPFYSIMITIAPSKGLAKGAIGGIVFAVVVAVAIACVVPILLTNYWRQRNKRIPFRKGFEFVQYCTRVITSYDNWRDLKGVYRENKPKSMATLFIKVYQKTNGNPGEDYEQRHLMAGVIKHFLREENSPWLPLAMQRNITNKEKTYMLGGALDVDTVKGLLGNNKNSAAQTRYSILRHLFLHFEWLANFQKELEPHSGVVDLAGLATCVSPSFFKESFAEYLKSIESSPSVERAQKGADMSQVHADFIAKLIEHASQIFPAEAEDTVNEADLTSKNLLAKDNIHVDVPVYENV